MPENLHSYISQDLYPLIESEIPSKNWHIFSVIGLLRDASLSAGVSACCALSENYLGFMNLENDLFCRKPLPPPTSSLLSDNFSPYPWSDLRGQVKPKFTHMVRLKIIRIFITFHELFINCFVSSRREFADGAEFKTRGTRSQIPENLSHVPEFGTRLQIHHRER